MAGVGPGQDIVGPARFLKTDPYLAKFTKWAGSGLTCFRQAGIEPGTCGGIGFGQDMGVF